jgi:hypothetical protein
MSGRLLIAVGVCFLLWGVGLHLQAHDPPPPGRYIVLVDPGGPDRAATSPEVIACLESCPCMVPRYVEPMVEAVCRMRRHQLGLDAMDPNSCLVGE